MTTDHKERNKEDCNFCYGLKSNGGFCEGKPATNEKCFGFTRMPAWFKQEIDEENKKKGGN